MHLPAFVFNDEALHVDEAVTIEHWYAVPGTVVQRGTPLALVRTATVAAILPAPLAGIVGTGEQPGTLVAAHAPLVAFVPAATTIPASAESTASTDSAESADPQSAATPQPRSTPLARRIAATHGLALAAVQGSGRGGRIVRRDVLVLMSADSTTNVADGSASQTEPTTNTEGSIAPQTTSPAHQAPIARGVPALQLIRPVDQAPTALAVVEIQLDAILRLCRIPSTGSRAVSLTPLLVIAQIVATQVVVQSAMNAQWIDDMGDGMPGLALRRMVNLGVQRGDDLRVVAAAQEQSVLGFARAWATASGTASSIVVRSSAAAWHEAALQPNHAATLTLGVAQRQAVASGEGIGWATLSLLTLCYDARIVTAWEADAFLAAIKRRAEAV